MSDLFPSETFREKRNPPKMIEIYAWWARETRGYRGTLSESPLRHFLEDPSEPCCFGCGWRIPEVYSLADTVGERWSYAQGYLDRAHLVDHSLGGSDKPGNYVPLCRDCHQKFDRQCFTSRAQALTYLHHLPDRCLSAQFATDSLFHGLPVTGNHLAVREVMREQEQRMSAARTLVDRLPREECEHLTRLPLEEFRRVIAEMMEVL